jgi:hypothetical protein
VVKRRRKRQLCEIAAPFTVAAPAGARIRDRLCVAADEAEVLRLVGEHLGRHQRADLAERVSIGAVKGKENRRAGRKKSLTAVSSSRWAGAMTRASEDQYQLSMRALYDDASTLHRAIRTIDKRLAVPCGQRNGKVRGYNDQAERFENSAGCRSSPPGSRPFRRRSPPVARRSPSAANSSPRCGTTWTKPSSRPSNGGNGGTRAGCS